MIKREYPQEPIASVGAVVRKGNQVLLIKRGEEPRKGEWSIPGGVIELGETVRQAAQRELVEECGVTIHPSQVLDVTDAIYRDEGGQIRYHYVLIDLAAEYICGELSVGSDIKEARWAMKEELPQFHLPEKTLAVILKSFDTMWRSSA